MAHPGRGALCANMSDTTLLRKLSGEWRAEETAVWSLNDSCEKTQA